MTAAQPTPIPSRKQYLHEYNCWKCMRARCRNPTDVSWCYYGAKGIRVCDRWQSSFEDFLADVGSAPTPEHQLDRLESTDNYEPGKVVWSTPAEQQENTSKVRFLTVEGVTLPITKWASLFRIPRETICSRIDDFGWSADNAVRTPVNAQFRRKPRKRPKKSR